MSYEDEVKCDNKDNIFDISDKSLLKTNKDIRDINCLTYNYKLDSAIVSTDIDMQVNKLNLLVI